MKEASKGSDLLTGLFSSLAGGSSFFLAYVLFHASFIVSLTAALLIYSMTLCTLLLWNRFYQRKSKRESMNENTPIAPHPPEIQIQLNKIRQIRKLLSELDEPKINAVANELCDDAEALLIKAKNHPSRHRVLHRFFPYYLDAAKKIILKCSQLTLHPVFNHDMEQQLIQAEAVLARLRRELKKQLLRFGKHEAVSLEVEIKTLEKILLNQAKSSSQ